MFEFILYRIYSRYSDRQTWTKSVDPRQTQRSSASDHGPTLLATHQVSSKMDLFKFQDKYAKERRKNVNKFWEKKWILQKARNTLKKWK